MKHVGSVIPSVRDRRNGEDLNGLYKLRKNFRLRNAIPWSAMYRRLKCLRKEMGCVEEED